MTQIFVEYKPVFDFFLIALGFAYSQQIVLRAGVFSVATAGFAALGGYATVILATRYGVQIPLAVLSAVLIGGFAGALLAIPLAQLRGAFQAIATLAFVKVVIALLLHFHEFTGGALGIHNIPRAVDTPWLLAAVAVTMYVMWSIGRTGVGRVFDALRQDEAVAATLGASIRRYHSLAFLLSGVFGGLFGSLQALYVFSIEPTAYGFGMIVSVLTAVVLGGRTTLLGPILGAAILTLVPELARPLADNRQLLNGIILILVMTVLPNGIGDELVFLIRRQRRRLRRNVARSSVALERGGDRAIAED